ncbi:hypothetical protein NDU88_010412 [Pleurodeles waltl]|uniref:Uncharacterized protein n=1 Tax=Pleurodeles waltl TaxID=8319 RepID=A0AAV7PXU8_PLEWA|nr:hypothetical protein NDU88_010412 [Pleurodeles waltl]
MYTNVTRKPSENLAEMAHCYVEKLTVSRPTGRKELEDPDDHREANNRPAATKEAYAPDESQQQAANKNILDLRFERLLHLNSISSAKKHTLIFLYIKARVLLENRILISPNT